MGISAGTLCAVIVVSCRHHDGETSYLSYLAINQAQSWLGLPILLSDFVVIPNLWLHQVSCKSLLGYNWQNKRLTCFSLCTGVAVFKLSLFTKPSSRLFNYFRQWAVSHHWAVAACLTTAVQSNFGRRQNDVVSHNVCSTTANDFL